MEHMAAPDRESIHERDHRFGHRPHHSLQLQHIQPRHTFVIHIAGVPPHMLVAPGAKRMHAVLRRGAVSGQQDDARLIIGPSILEGLNHLIDRFRPERVAFLRSVERDARHPLRFVIGDVAVLRHRLPVGATRYRHEFSSPYF